MQSRNRKCRNGFFGWAQEVSKKTHGHKRWKLQTYANVIFHLRADMPYVGRSLWIFAYGLISPTYSFTSNFVSISPCHSTRLSWSPVQQCKEYRATVIRSYFLILKTNADCTAYCLSFVVHICFLCLSLPLFSANKRFIYNRKFSTRSYF